MGEKHARDEIEAKRGKLPRIQLLRWDVKPGHFGSKKHAFSLKHLIFPSFFGDGIVEVQVQKDLLGCAKCWQQKEL